MAKMRGIFIGLIAITGAYIGIEVLTEPHFIWITGGLTALIMDTILDNE
jgi:hypothetical protein